MFEKFLTAAGLTENEAQVYEILLADGQSTAGKLHKKAPFKRGLIYKILDELVEKRLINKVEMPGKVTVFRVEHPQKISDLLDAEQQKIRHYKKSLEELMPRLVSNYNLAFNKPGIRFFEGLDGVKKVLDDTLINNLQRKILTFSDVAGYMKYLKEWNENYYAPRRKKFGIHEKVIIPNHPDAIEYMKGYKASEFTDILFVDHKLYPFSTEVNIYENKVSFVTFSEKAHIGVIVENKEIVDTLTSVFNFTWNLGEKLCGDIQPDWLKRQKEVKPLPSPPKEPPRSAEQTSKDPKGSPTPDIQK